MISFGLLDFGKHALFIWSAYGLSAIVLGGLILYTIKRGRHD